MPEPNLDQQIERKRIKPPRHPFRTLLAFLAVLFGGGAVLVVFGLVANTVPVASGLNASAPFPTATAARPENWQARAISGTLGTVDNPRVAAVVWQDFMEAYHWLYTTGWHPDYASAVSRYFMDGPADELDTQDMASGLRAFLDQSAQKREYVQVAVAGGSLEKSAEVYNFSPDGLKVDVSVIVEGKSQLWKLDTPLRLLSETSIEPNTRTVYTLKYDVTDKRWKIAGTR